MENCETEVAYESLSDIHEVDLMRIVPSLATFPSVAIWRFCFAAGKSCSCLVLANLSTFFRCLVDVKRFHRLLCSFQDIADA